MRSYIFLIALLFAATFASAQTIFLAKGKIEFERKINVHRQFETDNEEDAAWFKEYIARIPKFHTSYFDLYFNEDKTLYKHNRDGDGPKNIWGLGPSKENTIAVD